MNKVVQVDVTSTVASWILGPCLTVPAAIILFFQVPMMLDGSEQGAINAGLAAVMGVLGAAILTARHRAILDTGERTVTWRHTVFGLPWWTTRFPADEFVAMAVEKISGRVHGRTVTLVGRGGQRRTLKDYATVHDQSALEGCAAKLGWSIER